MVGGCTFKLFPDTLVKRYNHPPGYFICCHPVDKRSDVSRFLSFPNHRVTSKWAVWFVIEDAPFHLRDTGPFHGILLVLIQEFLLINDQLLNSLHYWKFSNLPDTVV